MLPCVAAARVAVVICLCTGTAAAQTPDGQPPPPPSSTPAPAEQPKEPPTTAATVEIDQTLVNIGTTLPLKRHHGYFRLTHRFAGDLRRGDFGDLASSLFTVDDGAIIGLEYRFAVTSRVQAGIHRSILGNTIVAFGLADLWRLMYG